jgi:LmbE family N-acetylglucosaminyl deacetylase
VAELLSDTPSVALAIYAHPDDPDVAAGGALARWAAEGAEVHVCICADGDKGSSDPALAAATLVATRRAETACAGRTLGVAAHHWLGFADGELDDGPALRAELVGLIRRVRPDVVVSADPTAVFFGQRYVNHRDHRAVGWAALDAVTPAAGNARYFPDRGAAHQVGALYLSGTLEPDVWVDIGAWIDVKASAVACHETQIGDSGEWLRRVVRQRAEEGGQQAGVRYAEGFRRVALV